MGETKISLTKYLENPGQWVLEKFKLETNTIKNYKLFFNQNFRKVTGNISVMFRFLSDEVILKKSILS
jgi:hypothetical protein